ncbi:MAG TPA: hypothetical protein VGE29_14020 [Prosthecobacter sp.]
MYSLFMPAAEVTQLVHITLDQTLLDDPARLQQAVERLQGAIGIEGSNSRRLSKYGILTGRIEAGKVAAARRIQGVVSVEIDSARTWR